MYRIPYKAQFTIEQRKSEANRVLATYKDRRPIICERSLHASYRCPTCDKIKYLVPIDITLGQFLYVIRRKLNLGQEKALYLFVHNRIPPSSILIGELYDLHKEIDNNLYLTYALENTFG